MKIEKAYILKIDEPISQKYAQDCSDSCDKVGLTWEYYNGYCNERRFEVWDELGMTKGVPLVSRYQRGIMSMMGHIAIIKQIWEKKECAVILEHDAIMLHKPTLDIPDGEIVVLGYKLKDITRYEHKKAGPPKERVSIDGHEGAHAYAITWKTAKMILDELNTKGISYDGMDNGYFLKERVNHTIIPLSILSPISALGWIRESTIWDGDPIESNYEFIKTFKNNLT